MKKQRLTIEIYDHRDNPKGGNRTVETFTSHGPYLRRMKKLAHEDAHMAEATKSVVHLLPEGQRRLFEGATGKEMEQRLEDTAADINP